MYVENGTFDVGLTGMDWIRENKSDVVIVDDLIYSKVSNRKARWVLCVKGDSPYKRPEDLDGKKISTELVGFTKEYFESLGVDVDVAFSWGTTEAKVVEGLCDGIVEITETGTTIRANGLRIIAELMQTNTQIIANKEAWENPEKRKLIEEINLLLQGALRAGKMVGLKMNLPKEKLAKLNGSLPSLNSPTVAELQDPNWLSVEIMVEEKIVRNLIPKLVEFGGRGHHRIPAEQGHLVPPPCKQTKAGRASRFSRLFPLKGITGQCRRRRLRPHTRWSGRPGAGQPDTASGRWGRS